MPLARQVRHSSWLWVKLKLMTKRFRGIAVVSYLQTLSVSAIHPASS